MNAKKLFDYSQPLVAAATILTVGGILATVFLGNTLYSIKVAGDMVEVTGSAKEAVVADMARWTIHLETQTGVNDQQAGFDRLDQAVETITSRLEELGFTEFETPIAQSWATHYYPQNSEPVQTGFNVSRDIIVRSNDVAALQELANNIGTLRGNGYQVSSYALELTYSQLAEARVRLLSEAIADAKERAEAIAHDSGRDVGELRTASSGVVQVLAEGGVDISDYGSYDTMSMNKEVMVTVRAAFSLE